MPREIFPVFPFLAVLVSFQLDFTMQKPSLEEAKILRMHGKSGFSAVSRMRMIFADCIWKQIFPRQRGSPALPDRDPEPGEACSNQIMFLNREDGWSFPIESPDETTKIVERESQYNEEPMSFQFCTGPQL